MLKNGIEVRRVRKFDASTMHSKYLNDNASCGCASDARETRMAIDLAGMWAWARGLIYTMRRICQMTGRSPSFRHPNIAHSYQCQLHMRTSIHTHTHPHRVHRQRLRILLRQTSRQWLVTSNFETALHLLQCIRTLLVGERIGKKCERTVEANLIVSSSISKEFAGGKLCVAKVWAKTS